MRSRATTLLQALVIPSLLAASSMARAAEPSPALDPAAAIWEPAPPPPPTAAVSAGASNRGTVAKANAAGARGANAKPDDVNPRDRAAGETTTLTGGVGLLRTQHAQGFAPGQFGLSFMTEFFSGNFLCTDSFKCPDPNGGNGKVVGDSLSHMGGHIGATVSVHKFVEVYGSTSAYASSSNANRPGLLQVLGDSVLGVKGHAAILPGFHVGLSGDLLLTNGTGAVGLEGSGTGARFRALATADLREAAKRLPMRASFNLGYTIDNTGEVVAGTEAARGAPVTRIERYGLNVNRTDHVDVALGIEGFFMKERLRPFGEFDILIPTNRQGYQCRPRNASGDLCLLNEPLAPGRMTIGARVLPWKRGFSLTAALDIGLFGTKTFIEEVAPMTPWMLHLGAGWVIDTEDRAETIRTVEKIIERGQAGVEVRGFVHEVDKTEGIGGAVVSWDNHTDRTSLYTSLDGRFLAYVLEDGEYKLGVKVDGYKPGACSFTKQRDQIEITVDCPLVALPRIGTMVGRLLDADTNAPIPNAAISVTDAGGKPLAGVTDGSGAFHFETLPAGSTQVTVNLEGYLATTESVDIKGQTEAKLDVLARKKPKTSQVSIGAKEIFIKQQVQFATDSSTILPQSMPLLGEIADILIKNPRLRRVEVQGHTDNAGAPDHNTQLSESRANTVRTWLASHGVSADRLTAKGFGQDKPIVPNVTQGNRAKNRRVQFVITEQDAAPPAKK